MIVYQGHDERYAADTCEPLKHAASIGAVELVARSRGNYPGAPLPRSALSGVRSLGCWNAERDQSWGLDWHRNEGIEITYVASGSVTLGVDGREFELRGGELSITRPWQVHRLGDPHVSASCVHWLILDTGVRRPNQEWTWPGWVILSNDDRNSLTKMLRQNEQPVWQADATIGHYFKLMRDSLTNNTEEVSESHLALYINGLLLGLTDLLRERRPTLNVDLSSSLRTVELFLDEVRKNPGSAWDIESMAAACGLRRSRFTHYCKRITNLTPNEFLTDCRIRAASHSLVAKQDLSITDVAYESGFGSSQYFATVFLRKTGLSPSQYRRENSETNSALK